MPTIVEYTERKSPRNQYPRRIISPPGSGPCCFSDMEEIGTTGQEGSWVFQYRRCRTCGFTVRVILRQLPDQARLERLRREMATIFTRNAPNY